MKPSRSHYRCQPGAVTLSGDPAVLGRMMSLIDNPDPDFAIVTP